MSGHDARRTGRSQFIAPGEIPSGPEWVFQSNGPVVGDIAISSEGVIYFASDRLYALNPDGNNFAVPVPVPAAPTGSPVVDDVNGFVYFAFIMTPPATFNQFFVVRYNKNLENPSEVFRGPASFYGGVSPMILGSDGTLYFSAGRYPSSITAVGETIWSRNVCLTESGGSPAIGADNKIYLMCPGASLFKLDNTTGNEIAHYPYQLYPVEPIIDDQNRLVSGYALFDGVATYGSFTKWDSNLNLISDSAGYTFYNITGSRSALMPDGVSTLQYGSNTPGQNVLSLRGNVTWLKLSGQVNYSTMFSTTATVDGEGNIFIGKASSVMRINPTDGTTVWEYPTSGRVTTQPSISENGAVYVGTDDGKIYAFPGRIKGQLNTPPSAGFTLTSGTQSAIDGETLSVISPRGNASVHFDASRSFDHDGEVVAYQWKLNGSVVSTTQAFDAILTYGTHTITLSVIDDDNAVSNLALGFIIVSERPCSASVGPADRFTRLVEDVENDPSPLGSRTPVILVHGNHGNEFEDGSDNVANPYRTYFKKLLYALNNERFESRYKVYRFHYVSDVFSVPEIARSFRDHLESEGCRDADFDKRVIIIAHSMGGLVARSYMNEYSHVSGNFAGQRGGERIDKLITLGTPHHGTPGANVESALELTPLGWANIWEVASFAYWNREECIIFDLADSLPPYCTDTNIPNRKDLLWDNYDGFLNPLNPDINLWLSVLNIQERYASKITAYYGYIAPNDPQRSRLIRTLAVSENFAGLLLGHLYQAKRRNDNPAALLGTNILLDYALGHYFNQNDGMVPVDSGRFTSAPIAKRVSCEGHNHEDMKDGSTRNCSTGLTLFDSLQEDLPVIVPGPRR